jgi:hypothetical protein
MSDRETYKTYRCSICAVKGHTKMNRRFHPVEDKAAAAAIREQTLSLNAIVRAGLLQDELAEEAKMAKLRETFAEWLPPDPYKL